MEEYLFWQHLRDLGGLHNSWWYTAAALPALIIGSVTLLMMLVSVRRLERKVMVFLLLLLACLPLVLIGPSAYVAFQPREAVGLVGMSWPLDQSQFPRPTAQALSQYLSVLTSMGIVGAVIGVLCTMGSLTMTASVVNVPVVSTAARQITQVMKDTTRRLRRQTTPAPTAQMDSASCPYGRLEVLNGAHMGNQFAIRPGDTLGRKECDMVITDSVTSRQHARFDTNDQGQTTVADQQSANGLFVHRVDATGTTQKHDLGAMGGQSFPLRSGDVVTLGDPDHPEDGEHAVKLRFEQTFR
ncbi:MAG: FHA domain-containing protein [Chloroflexota bacterium]